MFGYGFADNGIANNCKGNNDIAHDGIAKGYLIDTAVYVGHPESDLAMTKLFGGFTTEFYNAYAEHGMVTHDFNERIDFFNLYHY